MISKYAFIPIFFLAFCLNLYAVQISTPELSAEPDSTVTITIDVDDTTGIAGGDIVLEYEPAILKAVEAQTTGLTQSLTLIVNTDIEGKVTLSLAGAKGLEEGSGAIVEIDFEVKDSGESPLTFFEVALYDEMGDDIPVETQNGKITVKEKPTKKYPSWDVNDDGVVNIFDLILVGKHFGEDYRTGSPPKGEIGAPSGKEANVWIEAQNKVSRKSMRLLVVDIKVSPVQDLYGCQFDLVFDPKTFEVVGIKGGDILIQDRAETYWNVSGIDNQKGRIVNAIYTRKSTKKGISAGGTLATVVFRVEDVSISSSTRIDVTNIALADVDTRKIDAVVENSLLKWEELLIPEESTLLQNYPNPFNPETWIPFKLSNDANVVISIYDISGQLVRKIGLGRMSAGVYVSKDRAAYWDGRNSSEESVSSGIYFYHLKADDYDATKRMLILE